MDAKPVQLVRRTNAKTEKRARPKPTAEDFERAKAAIGQSLHALRLSRSGRKRLLRDTAHEVARMRVADEDRQRKAAARVTRSYGESGTVTVVADIEEDAAQTPDFKCPMTAKLLED